jgi:hypothetical protein
MEKKERLELVKKILKDNGIEMSVEGCGCCDSPCVTFIYKGEEILNDEGHCSFNTKDN